MVTFNKTIRHALNQYQTELNLIGADLGTLIIEKVGNGENNHIFKATVSNKVFIFRIPYRAELIPKLKEEFNTLKFIPKNIGPIPLIFHEGSDTYMIQSFVEGQHIAKWTNQFLQNHVHQMARLHSFTQKPCHGIDIIQLFQEKIHFRKVHDPEVLEDSVIQHLIHDVLASIRKFEKCFMAIKQTSFIHGDLHSGNILATAEALHYVDWEEARYGDPALDVVGILLSASADVHMQTYFDLYQLATHKDDDLFERSIVWSLYKDLSLLLHKKWESLDSKNRAITQKKQDYPDMLGQILQKMYSQIKILNKQHALADKA